MEMIRNQAWEKRLREFVASRSRRRFAWGSHDCCMFAADGVLAMTGTDLAADYRGRYKTQIGAGRKLSAAGGLEALVSARMGASVAVLQAHRGDLVLNTDAEPMLGICLGNRCAFAAVRGLAILPLNPKWVGWRI